MNLQTILRHFALLPTTDVSDALDRLDVDGAPRDILSLWPGCPKIVGLATTMRLVLSGPRSPVTGTLKAIMTAQPHDILVIDHGGQMDVNSWGGIATFTAAKRRLSGVVIDGVTRDIQEIRKLRFPVYGKGITQQSVRGRCAFGGLNVNVHLGNVLVKPRDLVMGDDNGIVVVPQAKIHDVLRLAKQSAQTNKKILRWIANGIDPIVAHQRANYERQ